VMGHGNGRSDLLYALVDDVSDLKVVIAEQRVNMAAIREELTEIKSGMTQMRKTMPDMMTLLQAACDKLVEHGQRLGRIEAHLASAKK
jgi:septation ring formation regulator EzrA